MTSLSIDTAAWVAPPDPVLELDALARQLEATAARLEAQTSRPGWPVANAACGSSEMTAAVEQRSCAAAQTVRALRLGALTARHLRASSDELEALVSRRAGPGGSRAV
jgi:hypothetical protein